MDDFYSFLIFCIFTVLVIANFLGITEYTLIFHFGLLNNAVIKVLYNGKKNF